MARKIHLFIHRKEERTLLQRNRNVLYFDSEEKPSCSSERVEFNFFIKWTNLRQSVNVVKLQIYLGRASVIAGYMQGAMDSAAENKINKKSGVSLAEKKKAITSKHVYTAGCFPAFNFCVF